MNKVKVKLTNGENINVKIDRLELIYGTTAVVASGIKENVMAINPITKEKLKIIDLSEPVNRFFIPAHSKKDFEYAMKNNLPLKQVIAPYYYGIGEQQPRDNIDTQVRHSIIMVLKDTQNNTYLCEDAKGRNCKSFIMGGIEGNETIEEAAIRETIEETGYLDFKVKKVSDFKIVNHFYADYKKVNRYAYLYIVYAELNTMKRNEISKEEASKHNIVWIKEEQLSDFINVSFGEYVIDFIIKGDCAYEKDGIMITNDSNNGKLSLETREILRKNIVETI